MRPWRIGIACQGCCVSLSAQGTINFSNTPAAIGGIGAPVFDVDGTTKLEGAAFLAQLYAGPDEYSLTACGPAVPFRTGAGAGFFDTTIGPPNPNGSLRLIPTVAPGAVAVVRIRAWELMPWSYEPVPPDKWGWSGVLFITTGGAGEPPSLPANLVGLQSFSLIPEPSSIALLVLGSVAVLLRRRR